MFQGRFGERRDVVERGGKAAFQQRAGAHGQAQRLAGARAGTPGDMLVHILGRSLAGARGADQREDGLDHFLADRKLADQALKLHQIVRRQHSLRLGLITAGGGVDHAPLGQLVRIANVDLQQKPVQLGLGQGIGALLLQWVLGRQHMERRGHVVAHAGNRDVVLLHGLQQRRLGFRAGAIDLVGHQDLGENRPLHKAERAPAAGAFLEHFGADDVRRHQVRGELDALAIGPQNGAQRVHQPGFSETRNADQQRMAARQQCNERLLNDFVLAEKDRSGRLFSAPHGVASRFYAGDDSVVGLTDGAHRRDYREANGVAT